MIPRGCKRLAEVDFPIAVVSKHAAREKSIRHGHPSTLHLWWARRPLASSRAVLLALLLPDPCDSLCPAEFKEQATEILTAVRQRPGSDEELQKALLWFIGAFANWDMAAHASYREVGRKLVQAAHGEEGPPPRPAGRRRRQRAGAPRGRHSAARRRRPTAGRRRRRRRRAAARRRGPRTRVRARRRPRGRRGGGAVHLVSSLQPSGAGAKWVAERQGNLHGRGEVRRAVPDASGCAAPETAPPPDAAEENGLHGAAEPPRRSSTSPTDSPVERATGVVRWTRTATFTTGGTARMGPSHGER